MMRMIRAWPSTNAWTQTLRAESALTASMPTPALLLGLGRTALMDRSCTHVDPFQVATIGMGSAPPTTAPAAQMSVADTALALNSTRLPVSTEVHPDCVRCQVPTPGPSP